MTVAKAKPAKLSSTASIVFLGSFDMQPLTPVWLYQHGLVSREAADEAEIEVIVRDLVKFEVDSMLVQATRDRLSVQAESEQHIEPMKDLMVNLIRFLPDIQIRKLGLNHEVRYSFSNRDSWNSIGDRLAPKEPWPKELDRPGLLAQLMKGERTDGQKGYIRVRVESFEDDGAPYGLFIEVNDHFDLDFSDDVAHGPEAAGIVQSHWRAATKRAEAIITAVTTNDR